MDSGPGPSRAGSPGAVSETPKSAEGSVVSCGEGSTFGSSEGAAVEGLIEGAAEGLAVVGDAVGLAVIGDAVGLPGATEGRAVEGI